jgi:hypothetical protein
MWPMELLWCCVTGTPPGNLMGINTRNYARLETVLFLCTYLACLLFIIYLYQQINKLKPPLFNAACFDLSIILVFNLKSHSISEMGSMVLPFESEISAL